MIRDMSMYTKPASVDELGLQFDFNKIDPNTGKIELLIREKKSNKRDFVIMKAIIFPGINILWIGCDDDPGNRAGCSTPDPSEPIFRITIT